MKSELEALRVKSVSRQVGLYIAFELSAGKWLVLFSDGQRNSQHQVIAGDKAKVLSLIEQARKRFKLAADARVVSCYEAGRDGFWLHRWLGEQGIENLVVDSGSIDVNRRARRVKTDRVDVHKLLDKLRAHYAGERVWSVVRVPTEQEEDARRAERERARLVKERGQHLSRMSSLLVLHNVRQMPARRKAWKAWLEGLEIGVQLKAELLRELERLELLDRQVAMLDKHGLAGTKEMTDKQEQLQTLKAVGPVSAMTLVAEVFGWRRFENRRQLAGCVGIAPSPYQSGQMDRVQGISKVGPKRVRPALVELSWAWLRYQPQSDLSKWYDQRFAKGGKRLRRIGIVALARRLLIALWRYLENGVIPAGASLKAV